MVKWTAHAETQLQHVYQYIALDSPLYARKVSAEIIRASLSLETFPQRGRMVPELGDPNVRELLPYSWRLIYEIKTDHIDVLAVIHQRQSLPPDVLPRES